MKKFMGEDFRDAYQNNQLSKILTWLVLGICVVVFGVQLVRAGNFSFNDTILPSFIFPKSPMLLHDITVKVAKKTNASAPAIILLRIYNCFFWFVLLWFCKSQIYKIFRFHNHFFIYLRFLQSFFSLLCVHLCSNYNLVVMKKLFWLFMMLCVKKRMLKRQ
mgnify:CR=1 FL=1